MKSLFHFDLQTLKTILISILLFSFFIFTNELYSQDKNFIGTKILRDGNNSKHQTFGVKNSFDENSFLDQSFVPSNLNQEKYV